MMKTSLVLAALVGSIAAPAFAQNYTQFPPPILYQNAQHSRLTGRHVVIPPYEQPFPVRVYTTPPVPPYDNVPPYTVISPY